MLVLTNLEAIESVQSRSVIHPGKIVERSLQGDCSLGCSRGVSVVQKWFLTMKQSWHEVIWVPFKRIRSQITLSTSG